MAIEMFRTARFLACCAAIVLPLACSGQAAAAGVAGHVWVEPAVAQPDANRIVRFSIWVDGVPAPGMRSFATRVRFSGDRIALAASVDTGADTPDDGAPVPGKITCGAVLRAAGARIRTTTIESGVGDFVLKSKGTGMGTIWFTMNQITDAVGAIYNGGVAGLGTTPQTGSGSLIDFGCYVDAAVPDGTVVEIIPELFPGLTGEILLNKSGSSPVINTLVSGRIQVGAAANTAPVLSPIADRVVAEGMTLSIALSASDLDGNAIAFSATGLPVGCALVGSAITCEPGFTSAGIYSVTVTASDNGTPSKADSKTFSLTIVNVNRAPFLDPIAKQDVDEGQSTTISLNAADPDGDALTLSAIGLPLGCTLAGNAIGCTLGYDTAGVYPVLVTATDAGQPSLIASRAFVLTVFGVNRAPTLVPIGNQTLNEGLIFKISLIASDLDGDTLTFSATGLPLGCAFADGAIDCELGYDAAGPYTVTVTATDSGAPQLTATGSFTLTVTNVNRAPVLDRISDQQVDEGQALRVPLVAKDADGDAVTLTATGLPVGCTLTDAAIGCAPGFKDAGTYPVTVTATDAGEPSKTDAKTFVLTVVDVNRAPVLDAIADQGVFEGQTLSIPLTAADPDGDLVTLGATGLPSGCTLTDSAIGCEPGYEAAGSFAITVSATDDGEPNRSDSKTFTLLVTNVNRSPVLAAIPDQDIDEGQTATVALSADDPDQDALTLSAVGLPGFCVLTDHGHGAGDIACSPGFDDAGESTVTVTASEPMPTVLPPMVAPMVAPLVVGDDDLPSATRTFVLQVKNVNRDPALAVQCDPSAYEGLPFACMLQATDPDGDALTLSASDLPTGAELTDNLDGTGRLDWTPNFGQAGTYVPTFYATDDGSPAKQAIVQQDIAVAVGNRRPVLTPIGDQTGAEGEPIALTLSAQDPDGDHLVFTASALPDGASLVDHADATASLHWTPTFEQAGNYPITFTVTDGGNPPLMDQETLTLSVGNGNRPPVLNHIGDRYMLEGRPLTIALIAGDPDSGDRLTFLCTLPGMTGVACADRGDGTAELTWTPGPDDQGVYPVTVTVTDDGSPAASDQEQFNVSVGNVNRAPTLGAVGNQALKTGETLRVPLAATDPDGDQLAFGVNGPPAGLSVVDSGNGTAALVWTPGAGAVGRHELEVYVVDDGRPTSASDAERISIEVTPAPNPPADIGGIPDQTAVENRLLTVVLSATDPQGDAIRFTLASAPVGATLTDNGNATAEIRWTPPCGSSGRYQLSVEATDGNSVVNRAFAVTVGPDPGLGYIRPSYQLVSSTSSGLFNSDNAYRATFVSQNGCPLTRVNARLSPSAKFTTIDGDVTFTNIPSQVWKPSDDTFTVRYSRLKGIDTSLFEWTLSR